MKAIIVTGSREWTDRDAIRRRLEAHEANAEALQLVIHGDTHPADWMIDSVASQLLCPTLAMPAPCARDRHFYMLQVLRVLGACGYEIGVDAFPLPGCREVEHMVRIARDAGVKVWVWGEDANA